METEPVVPWADVGGVTGAVGLPEPEARLTPSDDAKARKRDYMKAYMQAYRAKKRAAAGSES